MFRFLSTRFQRAAAAGAIEFPKFEIHNVRDDPIEGSLVRFTHDHRNIVVSHYPQLGPRKTDPNDPTPQFDLNKRSSIRIRQHDVAAMLCVVQGKLPSVAIVYPKNNLEFTKNLDAATGGATYLLKGTISASQDVTKSQDVISIGFKNEYATLLQTFLDASVADSFGFQFLKHQQQPQQYSTLQYRPPRQNQNQQQRSGANS